MSTPRLRVEHVLPSASSIREAVQRFCREPGTVTAYSDDRLRPLKRMVDEGSDVEVVAWGELVGRACLATGEPVLRQARSGQVRAAFELACAALTEGTPLSASATHPGLHSRLVRVVQELRHHRIGPDELRAAARIADVALASKFDTLATLLDDATERLAASGTEFASTRMERLMDGPATDLSAIGRVFVLAGSEDVPLYTEWLRWLSRCGATVVVAVEHLGPRSQHFVPGKALAGSLGGKVEEPSSQPWYGAVFHSIDAPIEPLEVSVASAADPLAECEWALRGCIDAIGKGVLPHRIAIIARDSETYAPLLTLSGARLGVPLKASVRVPLATVGFAALTQSLLSALASPDVRGLARSVRSSYLGLDPTTRAAVIEAIAAASREPHRAWSSLESWADSQSDERVAWIIAVLGWRDASLRDPASLAHWIERLRALWQTPPLPESVSSAENPTQERDVRARNVMERALLDRALVEDPQQYRSLTLGQFAKLCERLWAEEEVVLPETSMHGVHVAASPEQLAECDAVFVLGMLEGVIPRRRTEDPILGDEELSELSRLLPGSPRVPTSFDRARSERDAFVRLCASASQRLAFSYPQVGEDRDNVPAFYLAEIARIFSPAILTDHPRSLLAPRAEDCRTPADLALRQALDGPRARPVPGRIVSDAARDALAAPFEAGIEPRELDAVRSCSFMSSCRHRLSLYPSAQRTAWLRLRRLPVQAGLAVQPDRDSALRALQKALEEDQAGLLGSVDEWELQLLESAAQRLIPGLVEREFRARELWHAQDSQRTADVQFDGPDFRAEIPVAGRKVRVKGRAPAMSNVNGYRVLHLFESSVPDEKTSDETARERFLYRLGLTLFPSYRPEGVAAEVDGLSGTRTLFLVPRKEGAIPPGDASAGLKFSVLGDTLADFFRDVKAKLAESVEALAEPSMEPTPGEACDRCDYGELCRFSKQFGDPIERFADRASFGEEEAGE